MSEICFPSCGGRSVFSRSEERRVEEECRCQSAGGSDQQHEEKSSEREPGSCCSHWAGAGCQKFASLPAEGGVFFLDIPFYRTTLLVGARVPAGATSNMKRKVRRETLDRVAATGRERDVRNLLPFLRREECFF